MCRRVIDDRTGGVCRFVRGTDECRDVIKSAGLAALLSTAAVRGVAFAAAENEPASLDGNLKPYLDQYGLPALAAAVVKDGRTSPPARSEQGGSGRISRSGSTTGSNRLRHKGDDRAARGDAGRRGQTALGYAGRGNLSRADRQDGGTGRFIRLDQLLSHTSGIPSDNDAQDKLVMDSYWQTELNLDEMRYWMIERLVAMPLQSAPGERFAYANMGYVLAGAIAERLYRSTWEQLVAARIFDPLGLEDGRFRAAGDARPYRRAARAPPAAGRHAKSNACGPQRRQSRNDRSRWHGSPVDPGFRHVGGVEYRRGEARPGAGQTGDVAQAAHAVVDIPPVPDAKPGTPPPGKYALGWGIVSLPFAPEPLVFHGGSNQMNLAYIILQPSADFGMVMGTNVGGDKPDIALKALAQELYLRFAKAS